MNVKIRINPEDMVWDQLLGYSFVIQQVCSGPLVGIRSQESAVSQELVWNLKDLQEGGAGPEEASQWG